MAYIITFVITVKHVQTIIANSDSPRTHKMCSHDETCRSAYQTSDVIVVGSLSASGSEGRLQPAPHRSKRNRDESNAQVVATQCEYSTKYIRYNTPPLVGPNGNLNANRPERYGIALRVLGRNGNPIVFTHVMTVPVSRLPS